MLTVKLVRKGVDLSREKVLVALLQGTDRLVTLTVFWKAVERKGRAPCCSCDTCLTAVRIRIGKELARAHGVAP